VIVDNALGVQLHGSLTVPVGAHGLVVFAHGSGSSRNSPRNRQVAATLNMAGLATLLFDLLSEHEAQQRHNVFDIALLASRLQLAVDWLEAEGTARAGRCPPDFPLGFFGASTGGGAALWAAAYLGPRVSAVVVRGGRPDLARAKLPAVTAPTLLLVGGEDTHVLELNQLALQMMGASDSSQIAVVPEAGHLFEGPGQLEQVAELAVQWFRSHMGREGEAECGVLPKLMD
jgi:putative phosphoribosyl transferase